MDNERSQFPVSDAIETLLETPGIIWQSELRLFRELTHDWLATGGEFPAIADGLRESLHGRFEAGCLIEMGEFEFYRDHTGQFVISHGMSQVRLN